MKFQCLGILPIFALCSVSADASEWPQWGGRNECNMVSEEKNLPESFDFGKLDAATGEVEPGTSRNVLWAARFGKHTYGTPSVAGGRVIIGSSEGDPLKGHDAKHKYNGMLLCFDAATGKRVWKLIVPWRKEHLDSDDFDIGVSSAPAIVGDRVYVVSNRCEVLCLDLDGLADGNDGPYQTEAAYQNDALNFTADGPGGADIVWKYDFLSELGVRPHICASSSVLVRGGLVYAATCNAADRTGKRAGSESAPTLIALDRETGRLVAQDDQRIGTRLNHGQYSSPAIGRVGNRELILYGAGDGLCYAFDPEPEALPGNTLKVLKKVWSFDANPEEYRYFKDGRKIPYGHDQGPSDIIGTPVCLGGRVYVALGQDWSHGGSNGCLTCIDPAKPHPSGGPSAAWRNLRVPRTNSTPGVKDGLLYLPDQFGALHCVDAASGETVWTYRLRGNICASALVADGKVYLGTRDSREFAILASGREKREIFRVKLPSPLYGSPVAAQETGYLPTSTQLYALRKIKTGD